MKKELEMDHMYKVFWDDSREGILNPAIEVLAASFCH